MSPPSSLLTKPNPFSDGDGTAGAVVVKVNRLDGTAAALARSWDATGARTWTPLADGPEARGLTVREGVGGRIHAVLAIPLLAPGWRSPLEVDASVSLKGG